MYYPSHFEEQRTEVLLELIEQYPLATVMSNGPQGLVADHIPLMFEAVPGGTGRLVGHVARHNPLWQASAGQAHLLVFQGPSTYISPNWYATKALEGKVVPTWNYAVVHVHATLSATQDPQAIRALLDKLTRRHETAQAKPWSIDDAPAAYIDRLLDSIVAIEFEVQRMQGKWKVSQNQPVENQRSVVQALRATADMQGACSQQMAQLVDAFGRKDQN